MVTAQNTKDHLIALIDAIESEALLKKIMEFTEHIIAPEPTSAVVEELQRISDSYDTAPETFKAYEQVIDKVRLELKSNI